MLASPFVFLSSVTTDYVASRAVYLTLQEWEIGCFFCDMALFRAGDSLYRATVARAVKQSTHLVVVTGQPKDATRAVVWETREFSQGFSLIGESRPVITLITGAGSPEELPAALQAGLVLRFPDHLDALQPLLMNPQQKLSVLFPANEMSSRSGQREASGPHRKTLWLLCALTLVNAGLVCLTAWFMHRAEDFSRSDSNPADARSRPGDRKGIESIQAIDRETQSVVQEESAAGNSPAILQIQTAPSVPLVPDPEGLREAPRKSAVNLWGGKRAGDSYQLTIRDYRQVFSYIPAGSFLMGSPLSETGRKADETQRLVNIPEGFWLARTESTLPKWMEVMNSIPPENGEERNLPIHSIPWEEVSGEYDSFLERLNSMKIIPAGWRFDIPNEAQWEYACRAGTTTPFSFGTFLDGTQANCDGSLPYGTGKAGLFVNRVVPVATYLPNPWGLHDMHGNLAEWCRPVPANNALHDEDPSASMAARPIERGGSWRFHAGLCRSSSRETNGIGKADNVGFRLAIFAVN